MLYPLGRAFRVSNDSNLHKLHDALAESENTAYSSALSVLDSILPDNDNFTTDDATSWERRLGLITNTNTPLTDRKRGLIRKMNHPGTIKARQHYLYLERELRAAGFDVYIVENRFLASTTLDEQLGILEFGEWEFGGTNINPDKYEVTDPNTFSNEYANFTVEFGEWEFGGGIDYSLVANHIDETLDNDFFSTLTDFELPELGAVEFGEWEFGGTFTYLQALRSTFFVSGNTPTEMANILASRKDEFRQLILRIKPVQTIGILLINYNYYPIEEDFNDDFSDDFAI